MFVFGSVWGFFSLPFTTLFGGILQKIQSRMLKQVYLFELGFYCVSTFTKILMIRLGIFNFISQEQAGVLNVLHSRFGLTVQLPAGKRY